METIITTICSYCGKYLGEKDGLGVSGISHGCYEDCLQLELQKIRDRSKS